MDERKNRVLQAVIDDYVATAEPVGSRTIARKYRLGVSPATIRNEMADLEELGYLEQPHTSAGRVPSDRGYRYYVDWLMEFPALSPADEGRIRRAFERKFREIDALVRETARVLSETSHLTGVATGPQLSEAVLQEIRLIPLTSQTALLICMSDTGFIEKAVLDMSPEVTPQDLQNISWLLSERLRGEQIARLGRGLLEELWGQLGRYGPLLDQTLQLLEESLRPGSGYRVYVGGTTHLLEQPEFRDVEKARALFNFLDQPQVLEEVLDGTAETGQVSVRIGGEIQVRELQDCSIISATYRVGDRTVGRLGVIGPRRMEYGRMIALVEEITNHLTEAIQRARL